MPSHLAMNLSALVALMPACLAARRAAARDWLFWSTLALAVAVPALTVFGLMAGAWRTGLGEALWLTVATSLALFAALAWTSRTAAQLAPLLLPYLVLLGLLATAFGEPPEPSFTPAAPAAWVVLHVALSIAAYALLTIAAVAGLGVLMQERALKRKHPTALSRLLPPAADGDRLQWGLLIACAVVFAFGVATGMATEHFDRGVLLRLDHKTLLSLLSFVLVIGLLIAHRLSGLRGRRAARFILVAYLLLLLAYPGVKFVQDVLMA
ncbi:MAG TPA: cytochrome c biogenesis protein CcsA [Candidatus Sulfotelmatobacter sp.]|nr:cytochrome c biogenesis protein CcsA [Candidatus Sulfotelmatobacter sp.]